MNRIRTQKSVCALKGVLFVLLTVIIITLAGRILTPHFSGDHYERHSDFYEMPDDTVQVVFLGSSVVFNGIIPTELYEDYGICAFNLGTDSQPLMMSYYWMRETYDLHSESLTTVVLDCSMFRRSQKEEEYQKAISTMRLSRNKYYAVRDISDNLEDFMTYMFPVVSYHTRWSELDEESYELLIGGSGTGLLGYRVKSSQYTDSVTYDEADLPAYAVDSAAGEAQLYEESLTYLEKIVSFCEEKDLELLLIRMPSGSDHWSDEEHNAMQNAADRYGLTFLDFNYSPYLEELDYNGYTDRWDNHHLNYYGASKFTAWIGSYLAQNCNVTDIRGEENYVFMEEELADYQETLSAYDLSDVMDEYEALLEEGTDPSDLTDVYRQIYLYNLRCEDEKLVKTLRSDTDSLTAASYLAAFAENENYIIMISAQGDVSDVSDAALEEVFSQMGLSMRPDEASAGSYAAIVNGTKAAAEESASDGSKVQALISGYTVTSGGGEKASIKAGSSEYAQQSDGLNIVIWNQTTKMVVDTAVFNAQGICAQE